MAAVRRRARQLSEAARANAAGGSWGRSWVEKLQPSLASHKIFAAVFSGAPCATAAAHICASVQPGGGAKTSLQCVVLTLRTVTCLTSELELGLDRYL